MAENKELSEREREILRLVASGASNKEIASQLVISVNTVKVHLRNVYGKLGISSRSEATLYAVREGIIAAHVNVDKDGRFPEAQSNSVWMDIGKIIWATTTRKIASLIFLLLLISAAIFGLTKFVNQGSNTGALGNGSIMTNEEAELKRWHEHASLTEPRMSMAVVGYNNKIFVFGGENAEGVIGSVEMYDPETDTWEKLSGKPTAVSEISAGIIGGRMYVPGGKERDGQIANCLEVYLPSTNQWTKAKPMPVPLSAYAMATFEGHLYVFGGWDGTKFSKAVLDYDPSRDEWQERSQMPVARAYHGAAIVDGKIYILGGLNDDGVLSRVDAFSPASELRGENAWQQVDNLPQKRAKMGVLSIANMIYIFGGKDDKGKILPPLRYFPIDGTWNAFTAPEDSDYENPALAMIGTEIYILGGKDKSGEISMKNASYEAVYIVQIPVVH